MVIDDDVNEIEQSFALVAEIGDDVPDRFACFQRQVGNTECFGRTGATEIKIVDNDGMSITKFIDIIYEQKVLPQRYIAFNNNTLCLSIHKDCLSRQLSVSTSSLT